MGKKKIKNLIIAASISILGISFFSHEHKYEPEFKIISDETSLAFASYSKGLVYIGNKEYLENINNINENDILILDNRENDEDIKIYSSYKITDKDLRNDILCIICEYEKQNPSCWNRSIESMRLEWLVHNILYNMNYQTDRTEDVDFHNNEEELYDNKLLIKIFNL